MRKTFNETGKCTWHGWQEGRKYSCPEEVIYSPLDYLDVEEKEALINAGFVDSKRKFAVFPANAVFTVKSLESPGGGGPIVVFDALPENIFIFNHVFNDDCLYNIVESKKNSSVESRLLRDVKRILNEEAYAAAEFVRIPNSALKYLDGIQLFTYNDPNYSYSGLFDEELSERDDEYVQEILNGEKQHVFTVKGDEVYVNDKVPVDIDYSKHSEDPHACGTIIYKNPDNFKEVFSSDLTDDPRNYVNSDDIWFQVRIADLSNDKIKELINNCEFSNVDKRSILTALSKDELIDLL